MAEADQLTLEVKVTKGVHPWLQWLVDLVTGKDGNTVAIGRVIGIIIFIVFGLWLPSLIAGVLVLQKVKPEIWFQFMDKLAFYVPAISLAAAGFIAGTAFTEPKKAAD